MFTDAVQCGIIKKIDRERKNVFGKGAKLGEVESFAEYFRRIGRISSARQRGLLRRYLRYRMRKGAARYARKRIYARDGQRKHSAAR